MKKNKTGYYTITPSHIALYDRNHNHLANVEDWKGLERFGKAHGYFFAKEVEVVWN